MTTITGGGVATPRASIEHRDPDLRVPPDPSEAASLRFATYEGSGQVVHPDVAYFPGSWRGRELWMALTPYPYGMRQYENPSLFTSSGGESWEVAAGVNNPLVRTKRGHLSDPDVVYNAKRKELWLYYREVVLDGERHRSDNVLLTTSVDGAKWSAPSALFSEKGYLVSPTVAAGHDGKWRLWAVGAGTTGCGSMSTKVVMRSSWDGRRWGSPTTVSLDQPGYNVWHIDVQYLPARREYWAMYAAYPKGYACATTSLFLATSADGVRWTTYPSPILAPGALHQFATNVYRSTFAYDAAQDQVTIWFSGARAVITSGDGETPSYTMLWSAAVGRTSSTGLFARVSRPPSTRRMRPEPEGLRALAARNALP